LKDKYFGQISVFIVIVIIALFAFSYKFALEKIVPTPKVNAVYTVSERSSPVQSDSVSTKIISSAEAFFTIEKTVNEKYVGAKVLSCKGSQLLPVTVSSTPEISLESSGKLPYWSCIYYLNQPTIDFVTEWSQGKTIVQTAHQIWYPEESSIDYANRNFYAPLEYIDSEFLYSQLILSGFSPETEYYELYIGDFELSEKYKDKKIWLVNIFSKNDFGKKEDGSYSGTLLRKAIYDGETGKLIDFL